MTKVKPLPPTEAPAKGPSKYPDRPDKLVGQAFGPFQVGGLLARGRNATILRAHDTRTGKAIALKILPAAFSADEVKVERFMAAVKLMHTLRHPNIVSILGAGKAGPFCWLAQELVDGESMTQALRHVGVAGTFDWRRALRVSIYLTRAINFLHEHQIVYRNIGPQNIMIETEKVIPRLSDFLRVRPFYDLCEPGSNDSEELGDALLLFMAPEQTREMTEIDPRSDIFNLGALCYTFLTGHAPFEGGSLAETITKIRREQPELIKKYQLAVPEAFQGVVLQMLAKRPEDRYQTIAEVLRDLERVLKYQGMTLEV